MSSFVSISQVVGWEGCVFCTSQEIGWEDRLRNDLLWDVNLCTS